LRMPPPLSSDPWGLLVFSRRFSLVGDMFAHTMGTPAFRSRDRRPGSPVNLIQPMRSDLRPGADLRQKSFSFYHSLPFFPFARRAVPSICLLDASAFFGITCGRTLRTQFFCIASGFCCVCDVLWQHDRPLAQFPSPEMLFLKEGILRCVPGRPPPPFLLNAVVG